MQFQAEGTSIKILNIHFKLKYLCPIFAPVTIPGK